MTPLSLTLPICEAETATAYTSRLAALNGSGYVQDFVQDMGLSWRDVCAGKDNTIRDLAALAGVDPEDLGRFALRILAGHRRLVGREVIHMKLLRHRRQHVCAPCVLEAPRVGGAPALGFPVGWQVEAVRSCPVHRVELIELPSAEGPRSIFDLAGRIDDHRALIAQEGLAARPVPERGFERYLVERLHGHGRGHARDASWLDELGFGTVVRACETLGLVLAHGPEVRTDGLSPRQISDATEAGFGAIWGGAADLLSTLASVRGRATADGFYQEFTPFARWLGKLADDPGTSPLLDAVRDFIEDTYPVGPGEDVLGRPCRRRQIHSVMTAARHYGVNWTRMQRTIRAIADHPGFAGLPAPAPNLCFPADAYDAWLSRYAGSLGPKAAAKRLGVHVQVLKQMTDGGWLRPLLSFPGLVGRYDAADLQALRDGLLGRSRPVGAVEAGMALVFSACVVCACDALAILELIRAGRLAFVGRLEGRGGITSLIIKTGEVRDALGRSEIEGYRVEDLKRLLGVSSSTASWIMREGTIKSTVRVNPRTRKRVAIVAPADFEAFQEEYVTLGAVARAQRTLPKHAAARLGRRGVLPLPMPPSCSQIYRRAEVEKL